MVVSLLLSHACSSLALTLPETNDRSRPDSDRTACHNVADVTVLTAVTQAMVCLLIDERNTRVSPAIWSLSASNYASSYNYADVINERYPLTSWLGVAFVCYSSLPWGVERLIDRGWAGLGWEEFRFGRDKMICLRERLEEANYCGYWRKRVKLIKRRKCLSVTNAANRKSQYNFFIILHNKHAVPA